MTKDKVLSILINATDFVSGEIMSKKLGLSRASINAAVNKLKDEGYQISSVTNKGYKLDFLPDILCKEQVLAFLPEERTKNVMVLKTVNSTNTELKKLASEGASQGTVVISDEQTGGKGRLGRSFKSPAGNGIYFSYLLRPQDKPELISRITAWTSVAVSKAIKNAYGIDTDIKWVNDLLINNKKICGILTELTMEPESGHIDNVVIGIGINVDEEPEDFPEEIRHIASSIAYETNSPRLNRSKLAAELILQMDQLTKDWPNNFEPYLDYYKKNNITINKEVVVIKNDNQRQGKSLDVNEDFSLKIMYEDGSVEDVKSGEVSVRGLYGYT